MRYSIFNTSFSITKKTTIIYNAASDKFLLVKEADKGVLALSPTQLFEQYPTMYQEFVTSGILVEDNIDEYSQQLAISKEIKNDPFCFRLFINPTLDCNLHCWYCYENHIKDSNIKDSTFYSLQNFIQKKLHNSKKIKILQISFFGGEPFLRFEMVKQIILHSARCCSEENVRLQLYFTTNGVLLNNEIIDFFTDNKLDVGFQITLDGGITSHDKVRFTKGNKGTYHTIINNIQQLTEKQIPVVLRINYTVDNFSTIPLIIQDIRNWNDTSKQHVRIDLQRVWQDCEDELPIENIIEDFIANGFSVSTPILDVDNLRFPCYADYANQMLVNYNGDFFKCTARDFTPSNRIGFLKENGDVIWLKENPCDRINRLSPNECCSHCTIFPLCGGGCLQHLSEKNGNENTCTFNFTEERKKEIVINRFYNYFIKNKKSK